jgi:hypothetical protein
MLFSSAKWLSSSLRNRPLMMLPRMDMLSRAEVSVHVGMGVVQTGSGDDPILSSYCPCAVKQPAPGMFSARRLRHRHLIGLHVGLGTPVIEMVEMKLLPFTNIIYSAEANVKANEVPVAQPTGTEHTWSRLLDCTGTIGA